MIQLVIGAAAFFSTMMGGLFALRLRDKLHLILGFSAGAVVAVAFFDLIPEALALGGSAFSSANVIAFVALGFLLYLLLDRFLILHSHSFDEAQDEARMDVGGSPRVESRGHARAGALSVHSFLDGVGIGLAFQVSGAVGALVAVAVLTHDFSDGINTVSVIVRDGGKHKKALRWLLVDAIAPVAGIIVTLFFSLSHEWLGILLALFAGFFLYIGASDLVPESHHQHPTFWTTFMTLAGAVALFIVIRIAA